MLCPNIEGGLTLSRFHFGFSLKAGNGGRRAVILSVPTACSPGALCTAACKRAPSQWPILSVSGVCGATLPGSTHLSYQIYYSRPRAASQGKVVAGRKIGFVPTGTIGEEGSRFILRG